MRRERGDAVEHKSRSEYHPSLVRGTHHTYLPNPDRWLRQGFRRQPRKGNIRPSIIVLQNVELRPIK